MQSYVLKHVLKHLSAIEGEYVWSKFLFILPLFMFLLLVSNNSGADEHSAKSLKQATELLQQTQVASKKAALHNQARLSDFRQREAQLKQEYLALKQQLESVKQQSQLLAQQFSENEVQLAKKEQELRLATGSLGELFGVVRLSAKELQLEMQSSVAAIGQKEQHLLVDEIVAANTLPSKEQLQGLWKVILEQIQASGELEPIALTLVSDSGELYEQSALRIGAMALLNDSGFLNWDPKLATASVFSVQPEYSTYTEPFADGHILSIDPRRGELYAQLEQQASLKQRLEQGGVVGFIIILLLVLGILIALLQGAFLLRSRQQIYKQLKTPEQVQDNPLGRVLSVFNEELSHNIEALELRILEAVMDEQHRLERGLPLIKLFAALAPMLGLLGTVTGMIETFQSITQFGNADPRLLASGISMALVTTVLGLIAAMPLLLLHNVLNTQVETIRNVIEKQGVGLVAQQAEKLNTSLDCITDSPHARLERV